MTKFETDITNLIDFVLEQYDNYSTVIEGETTEESKVLHDIIHAIRGKQIELSIKVDMKNHELVDSVIAPLILCSNRIDLQDYIDTIV